MLLCWPRLSSCLVLFWLCVHTTALCPANCTCRLSDKGRRKVLCDKGGMHDPLPTSDMDVGMEVLEILAPPANPNKLTLSSIFKQFKSLQDLRMRNCGLLQIGMHVFWGVPTLRLLELSANNISSVYDHNFRGLVNLVELNLDDNRIASLQSGVFKHLTELRILTVQRNVIQELVPRMFLKLGKLHVLRLNGNQFEELDPEAFKDIPELRVLECRSCGLRRINTQIYHLLPYLSHLDLGDNQIHFIPADEFVDLRKVHSLKLDGNQLPVILERTFIHQHELKYLNVARNRLAKITNTAFLNLSSLVDLDIGYNKLDKIEGAALQHVSDTLQRLVISGNGFGLNVIKTILNTVHRVLDLEMAQMKIKSLPSGFFPRKIRKLDLARNNLTELKPDCLPQQLEELDLRDNNLRGLTEPTIFKLEEIKTVTLSANPWTCNQCNMTAVVFRVNRTSLFRNLTCASPRFLRGRLLTSLQLEELSSCLNFDVDSDDSNGINSKMGLVIGITSLLIFLAFCVIFVVFECMRRRARNAMKARKRMERRDASLDVAAGPTALFCKGEISFQFPLDLPVEHLHKVSISTIDEIKRDTALPNGTGI